jgi:hypothetical protein
MTAQSQIPSKILNLKFHYPPHKSPLLAPFVSQFNPSHNLLYSFCIMHSNVIFQSAYTYMISYLSLSFRISCQNCYIFFSRACYMPCSSPLIDRSNIFCGEAHNITERETNTFVHSDTAQAQITMLLERI